VTWGRSPGRASAEPAALTTVSNEAVIEETRDGLGTWRYTVPAGGSVIGPAPGSAQTGSKSVRQCPFPTLNGGRATSTATAAVDPDWTITTHGWKDSKVLSFEQLPRSNPYLRVAA